MIGEAIGRYRIDRSLEKFAFGERFSAHHVEAGHNTTITVFDETTSARSEPVKRYLDRVRWVARLHHPAIERVFEADVKQGHLYVVTEPVPGAPLAGTVEPARALAVAGRVAAAVAEAHAQDLVHGALTRDSVVVADDRPIVRDFGYDLLAGGAPASKADDVLALGRLVRGWCGDAKAGPAGEAMLDRMVADDPALRPTMDEVAQLFQPRAKTIMGGVSVGAAPDPFAPHSIRRTNDTGSHAVIDDQPKKPLKLGRGGPTAPAVAEEREHISVYRARRSRRGGRVPILVYLFQPPAAAAIAEEARAIFAERREQAAGTAARALQRKLRAGEKLELSLAAAGAAAEVPPAIAWQPPFVRFDAALVVAREMRELEAVAIVRAGKDELARVMFDLRVAARSPRAALVSGLAAAGVAGVALALAHVAPATPTATAGAACLAGTVTIALRPDRPTVLATRDWPVPTPLAKLSDHTTASFVVHYAARAIELARVDARLGLHVARQCLEAIARDMYERKFEPPGSKPLDTLLRRLDEAKLVPERVGIAAGTVQRWGNFGSHPNDPSELPKTAADASLVSLRDVVRWYFEDVLSVAVPDTLRFPS